jgi:hypothetical protein
MAESWQAETSEEEAAIGRSTHRRRSGTLRLGVRRSIAYLWRTIWSVTFEPVLDQKDVGRHLREKRCDDERRDRCGTNSSDGQSMY